MKKTILWGVVGLAVLLAVPSMVATQNLKGTAPVAGDLAVTTACYRLAPFCDELTVNIAPNGLISGWDDSCGTCAFQVGGRKSGGDFVIFLDYSPEDCGAAFRYGLIIGTGLKGTLYRYWPSGALYGTTKVQLMPCTEVAAAALNLGPSSKAK